MTRLDHALEILAPFSGQEHYDVAVASVRRAYERKGFEAALKMARAIADAFIDFSLDRALA